MRTARTVRISGGLGSFRATLVRPPIVHRAAVLLHGLCVDQNEYGQFYEELAAELAKVNVASLRFDFSGHGSRKRSWKQFSIARQVCEAVDAVDWAASHLFENNARVTLIGTSFGSPPAIFAAIERANFVDRVVLLSPVLDYQATFFDPVTEWGEECFGRERIREAGRRGWLDLGGTKLPTRLFQEMLVVRPLDALARVEAPMLIIHGAADGMVPVGPSRVAAKLAGVNFREIRTMDHGPFDIRDDDEVGPHSSLLRSRILSLITSFAAGRDLGSEGGGNGAST
jgi:pimeloyl-ACP methyl ester carboxylesterase